MEKELIVQLVEVMNFKNEVLWSITKVSILRGDSIVLDFYKIYPTLSILEYSHILRL